MTEKIKAYSYLRISTEAQSIGDGVRRQMESSKKYAEENGYELVETIRDIGVSGYGGKNANTGAFGKFLTAIQEGEVRRGSVLIVESLDRLSRNQVTRAFSQFTNILNHGITIVTLSDEQVYTEESVNSDFAQLFLSIAIMIRANDESETKSKRIKSAWKQKRDVIKERKMTKMNPAWLELDLDRKNFTVKQKSADTVREIFKLCIDGMGVYSITRHLNGDLKRFPPISSAKRWNDSYVAKILNNAAVFGQFQPHQRIDGKRQPVGDPIADYFPKIISEETFYLAKSAMSQRRILGAGRKGKELSNLFSGLVTCATCGGTVTMRNKGKPPRGYSYLRCNNSLLNNGCRCPAWRYSEFEASFYEFVKDVSFSDIFTNHESQYLGNELKNRLTSRREKLSDMKISYENLLSHFDDPSLSAGLLGDLKNRAEDKRAEIDNIQNEIEALKTEILKSNFEEVTQDQSDFIASYEALKHSKDKPKLKEVRFRIHSILRKTVESIKIYNGETVNPWEASDNISSKLRQELRERGVNTSEQIERFFEKAAGKRLFNHSVRLFVVRFKNGAVRVAHPYENATYLSISERLLNA